MSRLVMLVVMVGLLLVSTGTFVLASGFATIEQSVSGLGNAFAGGAASAEDATRFSLTRRG